MSPPEKRSSTRGMPPIPRDDDDDPIFDPNDPSQTMRLVRDAREQLGRVWKSITRLEGGLTRLEDSFSKREALAHDKIQEVRDEVHAMNAELSSSLGKLLVNAHEETSTRGVRAQVAAKELEVAEGRAKIERDNQRHTVGMWVMVIGVVVTGITGVVMAVRGGSVTTNQITSPPAIVRVPAVVPIPVPVEPAPP